MDIDEEATTNHVDNDDATQLQGGGVDQDNNTAAVRGGATENRGTISDEILVDAAQESNEDAADVVDNVTNEAATVTVDNVTNEFQPKSIRLAENDIFIDTDSDEDEELINKNRKKPIQKSRRPDRNHNKRSKSRTKRSKSRTQRSKSRNSKSKRIKNDEITYRGFYESEGEDEHGNSVKIRKSTRLKQKRDDISISSANKNSSFKISSSRCDKFLLLYV